MSRSSSRANPLRLVRLLWSSWRNELTAQGKAVVLAGLVSALGLATVQAPVHQVACALAALCTAAILCGLAVVPRVELTGTFPERTTVGLPATGRFRVTNRSRMPAWDVGVGFLDVHATIDEPTADLIVPELRRGETAETTVVLVPRMRGVYPLPPLRAYTTFPFQLFRLGKVRGPAGSLLVLPHYEPEDWDPLNVQPRYQQGGLALTSRVGESPEYVGNREYVPGEPARRLDFRSWARLGRPVVRDYQEEYYCRIALVLDTFVPETRGWNLGGLGVDAQGRRVVRLPGTLPATSPALEAAVSLTAAAAEALSHGEYVIDLFAAGPALHVFRSGRHTAHFENVLEILAGTGPSRTDPFATVAPAVSEELGRIAAAVCVFLDWDEPRRRLARAVVESGCALKVVIVRDGPTTLPFADDGFEDVSQRSVGSVAATAPDRGDPAEPETAPNRGARP